MTTEMNVRVALPSRLVGTWVATRLRADGAHGAFGILPKHIDCAVMLEQGILELVLADGTETYVAVDTGLLVKRGADVFVSTRRALASPDLLELQHTVRDVLRQRDEGEVRARAAASKLEMGFVRRIFELREGSRGR